MSNHPKTKQFLEMLRQSGVARYVGPLPGTTATDEAVQIDFGASLAPKAVPGPIAPAAAARLPPLPAGVPPFDENDLLEGKATLSAEERAQKRAERLMFGSST